MSDKCNQGDWLQMNWAIDNTKLGSFDVKKNILQIDSIIFEMENYNNNKIQSRLLSENVTRVLYNMKVHGLNNTFEN